MLFIYKPTNPEFITPSTFSHIQPVFSLHQIILETDTRQPNTAPIAQSMLELFKLPNPELFIPPCLAFPMETPERRWSKFSTLAPVFELLPPSWLPPWLCVACSDPCLGPVNIINYFLPSLVLICCSCTHFIIPYPICTFLKHRYRKTKRHLLRRCQMERFLQGS